MVVETFKKLFVDKTYHSQIYIYKYNRKCIINHN